ncbi:hypothetical protein FC83_GL000387 [Agrilactobacillus composti DSM 18527 = JCM 14202]|uniref:Uncharacterized protein n=1 Tax=Agrilactobacillus composti DSM 18527 = JCM 14202 TaxID=1423734 RepID=X0PS28_9LACO|nr:hypothetical protein [Agrilactobacillus composti]KRM32521.1 hypothetical protein FC83_GL000387 [Agrilactobacillus composti DSM 18527 = JCM 14202]GAF39961.1 hypothetical protein JCM14202_1843 [Agrilactobacillus composti DSM 18527 = JCM 14202]
MGFIIRLFCGYWLIKGSIVVICAFVDQHWTYMAVHHSTLVAMIAGFIGIWLEMRLNAFARRKWPKVFATM